MKPAVALFHMLNIRTLCSSLFPLLLAAGCGGGEGGGEGREPRVVAQASVEAPQTNEAGPSVSVVVTTNDQTQRLAPQASAQFSTPANADTIGSSDLSRFHYTYDDVPQGETDPTLANFSIDVDRADRIPIIQWAKRLNPEMLLLASVWSAPAWMKTNDSLYGGDLRPEAWGAWAEYYVKYLQAYEAEGIGIDLISHQNEPDYASLDYPGMEKNPETQRLLLRNYILPSLEASGLDTRVLIFDHNWDNTIFPARVLTDSQVGDSERVAGTAWHWYGGTPGAMTVLHNLFPDKENYVTEASSGAWIADPDTNDFEMIIQSMRNWSRSFIKWALALDENRGPHLGGCDQCAPVVTVNSITGDVSYEIDYYTLGHFSKYVLPGATRIYSINPTGMISVAFQNPDGSKALIAFNDTDADKDFQLVWGRQSFRYTLPRYSGATFTWSGTQSETYPIPATTKIQSSSYDDVFALQTETTSDVDGGYNLGFSINDSYARYNNIDFGAGVTEVEARVANAADARGGSTIEFHLDTPGGLRIATVPVPDAGGYQSWTTVTSPVDVPVTGIHDVYIVFKSNGSAGNVNWFDFR